jgi:hypothetical protein
MWFCKILRLFLAYFPFVKNDSKCTRLSYSLYVYVYLCTVSKLLNLMIDFHENLNYYAN